MVLSVGMPGRTSGAQASGPSSSFRIRSSRISCSGGPHGARAGRRRRLRRLRGLSASRAKRYRSPFWVTFMLAWAAVTKPCTYCANSSSLPLRIVHRPLRLSFSTRAWAIRMLLSSGLRPPVGSDAKYSSHRRFSGIDPLRSDPRLADLMVASESWRSAGVASGKNRRLGRARRAAQALSSDAVRFENGVAVSCERTGSSSAFALSMVDGLRRDVVANRVG